METHNLFREADGFALFETTARSQTAVMRLGPGEASSEKPSRHEKSDQILLVVQGALRAEIGGEVRDLTKGDLVTVPADTPHRFVNAGKEEALAFTAYAPPAY